MARMQVYVSDDVAEKILAIVEQRRAEGAREKDVSQSSITTMLVELGLRVYEAQMERKASGFNQMEYNKVLLENVIKTQLSIARILGISSLSPHVSSIEKFKYQNMVENIMEEMAIQLEKFFPLNEDES